MELLATRIVECGRVETRAGGRTGIPKATGRAWNFGAYTSLALRRRFRW